jgi:hypothetical protein
LDDAELNAVIPGRVERANPESIFPFYKWIPGLRQVAHPGMTITELIQETIQG